jgi:hypothetical protein
LSRLRNFLVSEFDSLSVLSGKLALAPVIDDNELHNHPTKWRALSKTKCDVHVIRVKLKIHQSIRAQSVRKAIQLSSGDAREGRQQTTPPGQKFELKFNCESQKNKLGEKIQKMKKRVFN